MKKPPGEGGKLAKKRVRARPAGSWLPWIFSVILALILWITAIQERSFSVSVILPVTPPVLPAQYMVMNDLSAESVLVEFSGTGAQVILDQVFRQPSGIDLGEYEPSSEGAFPRRVSYQITSGNVAFEGTQSLSLEATGFTPGAISMLIDRKMSRSVPVSVPAAGSVPGRFMWPDFSMTSVEVTGAATVIASMDSVETEAVLPGEDQARVSVTVRQGVSGSSPRTISAAYIPPVPVVYGASN
jgi:hypothetical protein